MACKSITQRAVDELLEFKLFLAICTITGFTCIYPALFLYLQRAQSVTVIRRSRKKSEVRRKPVYPQSLTRTRTSRATCHGPGFPHSGVPTVVVLPLPTTSSLHVPQLRVLCSVSRHAPLLTATRLPSRVRKRFRWQSPSIWLDESSCSSGPRDEGKQIWS